MDLAELGVAVVLGYYFVFFGFGECGHGFGDAGEVVHFGVCAFWFCDLLALYEHDGWCVRRLCGVICANIAKVQVREIS